jgi:DNA polymerase
MARNTRTDQKTEQWKETQSARLGKRAVVSKKALQKDWDRLHGVDTTKSKAHPPVAAKTKAPSPAAIKETLEDIKKEVDRCKGCKLHSTRTNTVFGEGNPKAEIMFIGEAPGETEDLQGRPFVGRAGQLLDKIIEAMGYKRSDVYIANVVKSRPPGNRPPEADEVAACSPFLFRQINVVKPKVLVALGGTSLKCLFGDEAKISAMRGKFIDYRGVPLMPTFHPAYLLRNPAAKKEVWEDMKVVLTHLGKKAPAKV